MLWYSYEMVLLKTPHICKIWWKFGKLKILLYIDPRIDILPDGQTNLKHLWIVNFLNDLLNK